MTTSYLAKQLLNLKQCVLNEQVENVRKQCNIQILRMIEELSALQLVRTSNLKDIYCVALNWVLYKQVLYVFFSFPAVAVSLQECADKQSQIERSLRERKAVEEELEKVSWQLHVARFLNKKNKMKKNVSCDVLF